MGRISAPQTVTVTNSGSLPLTINAGTGLVLAGANQQFTLLNTGNCVAGSSGVTVAAGSSCTIDVQFKPTSVLGANSATLNIADNTAASPQTVSLTGTGTASGLTVSLTSPAVLNLKIP
ncbi:MAG: choice-of-anchor D domain-containing protein [Gallionella sp.]